MASLTVQYESGEEKFALEAGTVTLGRGLESDIRLKDIKASRRHCQVVKIQQGYKLVDLGSGNGTYVNGILVNREQPLRPGDAIQIGSTTIVFVDGAAAGGAKPASAKSVTEADRRNASSATSRLPAVPKPGTRATSKTPTAATKKIEAVAAAPGKKATGPLPTAVKPATGKIPATAGGSTTRRGGTGKVPTAKPTTQRKTRGSMSERFAAESGKKKMNPMIFLIGGAGVLLVGIIVIVFVAGGGNDLVYDKDQVKQKTEKAAKAIAADNYDEAIALYQDAMKICEKHKELSQEKERLKKEIENCETAKKDRAGVEEDWSKLKAEAKASKYSDKKESIKEFMDKVKRVRDNGRTLNMAFARPEGKSEIDKLYETVKHEYDTAVSTDKGKDFQAWRNNKVEPLLKGDKPDFAGAVKLWSEYVSGVAKSEFEKNKATGALADVNNRAKEAAVKLIRQTEGKEKADAIKLLEEALPRFEGCKRLDDSGAVAEDIEKMLRDKIDELKK